MKEYYPNVEEAKSVGSRPSSNRTGPRSSGSGCLGAVTHCIGLLTVFLLAGLIGLLVYDHVSVRGPAADLFAIKANLTERLLASEDQLSSVSAERDLLKATLTEKTKELERLQLLSKQKKTCPAGWRMFNNSCYLHSSASGSWEEARHDCRDRGADLVTIHSYEEQEFLSNYIKKHTWIGLNDRDNEGVWKWVDGTPLTEAYWRSGMPDNGAGNPQWGEEDCVQIQKGKTLRENWNDLHCDTDLQWICKKIPDFVPPTAPDMVVQ